MNFTFEALEAAQTALNNLRNCFAVRCPKIARLQSPKRSDGGQGCAEYEERFLEAINDDLNIPKALGIAWELVKSDYPASARAESLLNSIKFWDLTLKMQKLHKKRRRNYSTESHGISWAEEELRKKKDFIWQIKCAIRLRKWAMKFKTTTMDQ